MTKLLSLDNIRLTYHTTKTQVDAIKNISFDIDEGKFVAIIGPSGCGKTTILSIIAGLLKPSSGKVLLQNKLVEAPSSDIGYMLQKDQLFSWLTIEENVFLPLKIKKINTPQNREYCYILLDKYGLKDFKKSYPSQLSGGMRQRVALIRTLASSPKLLLLDEAFSALDYQTRLNVCDDVYKIIRKENKTSILVTHDLSEAISLADEIIVLSNRPSTVFNIHKINLGQNLSPLERREVAGFSKWFEILWRELNNETKKP